MITVEEFNRKQKAMKETFRAYQRPHDLKMVLFWSRVFPGCNDEYYCSKCYCWHSRGSKIAIRHTRLGYEVTPEMARQELLALDAEGKAYEELTPTLFSRMVAVASGKEKEVIRLLK